MHIRKCPFCAEIIQSEATICKHCKKEVLTPEQEKNQEREKYLATMSDEQRRDYIKREQDEEIERGVVKERALIVGLGLFIIFVFVIYNSSSSSDTSTSSSSSGYSSSSAPSGGDSTSAYSCAKDAVKKHLKSPSSASFPSVSSANPGDVSIRKSGSSWIVNSFVDSQNSFGANLRTPFRCTVNDYGDSCSASCDLSN